MPTFILSLNWTDQESAQSRTLLSELKPLKELAKKVGVEIKQVYLTTGEDDLPSSSWMLPMETTSQNLHSPLGAQGNVRTRTVALGLSPNSKSSYPSFHKASWLEKETSKITPRREGVLSGTCYYDGKSRRYQRECPLMGTLGLRATRGPLNLQTR